MEALSGENAEEYFKVLDDELQVIMRKDTWGIFLRNSVADHDVLPGNGLSSERGNLIVKSVNSRHDIV